MCTKQYDRTAFIRAYIDASQLDYLHEDFRTYYKGLLDALQRAFDITFSLNGVRNREAAALWVLFHATVRSYQNIQTPRSGFIEDTLLNSTLDRLGERGEPIVALEETIRTTATSNKETHWRLLDELFLLLWGPVDTVVTSKDLLEIGFDDTKEPKKSDYLDYM